MIITQDTPRENIIQVEKALQVSPCMRQVVNIVRVMNDDREFDVRRPCTGHHGEYRKRL